MKNIIAIFIIIITVSGLIAYGSNTSNSILPEPEGTLKPGKYTCPYIRETTNSCIMEVYKSGMTVRTNCPNNSSEILSLIKAGKCTVEPDNTISYSCQYPQGSCRVTLGDSMEYYVSCSGKTPDTKTVLQDTKNGKCYKY